MYHRHTRRFNSIVAHPKKQFHSLLLFLLLVVQFLPQLFTFYSISIALKNVEHLIFAHKWGEKRYAQENCLPSILSQDFNQKLNRIKNVFLIPANCNYKQTKFRGCGLIKIPPAPGEDSNRRDYNTIDKFFFLAISRDCKQTTNLFLAPSGNYGWINDGFMDNRELNLTELHLWPTIIQVE